MGADREGKRSETGLSEERTLSMRHLWFSLCVNALAWFAAGSVSAQDYPNKVVRFVVPNTAGSNPDVIARIMAPEMSRFLGQPVIVENKPGAGQLIGFEYVAKQLPADGYAFVVTAVPILVSLPLMVKDLRFDPIKDLPPFVGAIESRLYFGVPSKWPWKSVEELIAYSKANPGKLNYGSTSVITRIYTEYLIREFGLNVTHVPYSGASTLNQALVAGDVQMAFLGDGPIAALGQQFRVLALSGDQRFALFPNVPTFGELKLRLPSILYSLHVRAGTPKPVIDKLHAAASSALKHPDVNGQFEKLQSKVVNLAPQAATTKVADAAKLYADIAKQIGLEPQ